MKAIVWIGDSRHRVRDFPEAVRARAGYELWLVQQGEDPSDWKPMPSVGLGVREIRVRMGGAFRVLYVARFSEAVYVLHAFQKKSQKTSQPDLEAAKMRFRQLIEQRRHG